MTSKLAKTFKEGFALTAALATPDNNVAIPRITKPGSFLSLVKGLAVGETATKSVLVDPDHTLFDFSMRAADERTKLRNNMQSTMNAATKDSDMKFECEIVTTITPQNRIYHVAIITRTA